MVDISALHDDQGGKSATWRSDRDFRCFAWAARATTPGVEELRSYTYTGTLRALTCPYTVAPSAVGTNGACGICQRIPFDGSFKRRAQRISEDRAPSSHTRNDYLSGTAVSAKLVGQSLTIRRLPRQLNWEKIKNTSLRVRIRTLRESAAESAERGDVRKLIDDLKVRR